MSDLMRIMWQELLAASDNYLELIKNINKLRAEKEKTAERLVLIKRLLAIDGRDPINLSAK